MMIEGFLNYVDLIGHAFFYYFKPYIANVTNYVQQQRIMDGFLSQFLDHECMTLPWQKH